MRANGTMGLALVMALALAGCGGREDAADDAGAAVARADAVKAPAIPAKPAGDSTTASSGARPMPPVPDRVGRMSAADFRGRPLASAKDRSVRTAALVPPDRMMDAMTVYSCWAADGRAKPGMAPEEIARVAREMTPKDVAACRR